MSTNNNKNLLKLINKFLEGKASLEEIKKAYNFFLSHQKITKWPVYFGSKKQVEDKIYHKIKSSIKIGSFKNTQKVIPLYKRSIFKYAVAASILLMISITVIMKVTNTVIDAAIIVDNNIKIGTDKATLTLEDGTTIALEQGQQYVSDNLESNGEELVYKVPSTKKAEIAYNYLTIPRGGQYHIKLSDGTEVWLNSESQIKYPITFSEGETRQVELVYGEAYFNVSPSTNHKGSKFKVLTGSQEIEVLGTEFNISAYKGEDTIYTTLVKGKIAIVNGNANTILSPNQQSIINKNISGINVVKADVYSVTSWREGIFSFDNIPLENIMKVLARWYDVDVVFVDAKLKDEHFTGVLRKNQNIEDILQSIQTTNNIAYVIKNNTVIFK